MFLNKDPIQKNFYDFIAQCVFYSIYLAFPKSRHIFTSEFKNSIVCIFAYLFNGLTLLKYSIDHWDLDLGTGNIIEKDDFYNFKKDGGGNYNILYSLNQFIINYYIYNIFIIKDKLPIVLPKISDIQKFGIFHIRENKHKKGKSISDVSSLRSEKNKEKKNKDIVNTPLYRLYAEYKSFASFSSFLLN